MAVVTHTNASSPGAKTSPRPPTCACGEMAWDSAAPREAAAVNSRPVSLDASQQASLALARALEAGGGGAEAEALLPGEKAPYQRARRNACGPPWRRAARRSAWPG